MRRMNLLIAASVPLLALSACAGRSDAVPDAVPVFFRNGATTLTPEARDSVMTAANIAKDHPGYRLVLQGHGLPVGAPVEPAQMAAARAQAVQDELVRDGVADNRITTRAGGALSVPPDSSVAARRVDIDFTRLPKL